VDEFENGIEQEFLQYAIPRVHSTGLPFWTTALGVLNADGASSLETSPGFPMPEVIDNQEQVDYIEAGLRILKTYGSRGAFFWAYHVGWYPGPDSINWELTPRPAEQLISFWSGQ
jgi:hypothetical protein